jgi:hypothetical protein
LHCSSAVFDHTCPSFFDINFQDRLRTIISYNRILVLEAGEVAVSDIMGS